MKPGSDGRRRRPRTGPTWTLFLLLPLLGCGEDSNGSGPVEPELKPIPEVRYPDIEPDEFLRLDPPEELPHLQWKLPRGTVHNYALDQTAYILDLRAPEDRRQGRIDYGGILAMEAETDGKAAVRLSLIPPGVNPLDKEKVRRYDYALKEDGGFYPTTDETARQSGMHLDVLLTLPGRPLSVGESVEKKVTSPGGPNAFAHRGTQKITLTGYFKVGPHACARLESEVALELSPSKDSLMRGGGRMRTRIVSYFAYAEGFFVRITAADRQAIRAWQPVEKDGVPGMVIIERDLDTTVRIRKK